MSSYNRESGGSSSRNSLGGLNVTFFSTVLSGVTDALACIRKSEFEGTMLAFYSVDSG